jgi:MFS family permease
MGMFITLLVRCVIKRIISDILIVPSSIRLVSYIRSSLSAQQELNMCSGMLFAGRFADLYGRKLLFLVGLGFSFVCTMLSPVCNVRTLSCPIDELTRECRV